LAKLDAVGVRLEEHFKKAKQGGNMQTISRAPIGRSGEGWNDEMGGNGAFAPFSNSSPLYKKNGEPRGKIITKLGGTQGK